MAERADARRNRERLLAAAAAAFAARKRHRVPGPLVREIKCTKHLGKARFVFPIRSTGADDYVGLHALPEKLVVYVLHY